MFAMSHIKKVHMPEKGMELIMDDKDPEDEEEYLADNEHSDVDAAEWNYEPEGEGSEDNDWKAERDYVEKWQVELWQDEEYEEQFEELSDWKETESEICILIESEKEPKDRLSFDSTHVECCMMEVPITGPPPPEEGEDPEPVAEEELEVMSLVSAE